MATSTVPNARSRPARGVFSRSECFFNQRERLPYARFGNSRFMWGCVGLTVLLMFLMANVK
jgi:hypothetical protein